MNRFLLTVAAGSMIILASCSQEEVNPTTTPKQEELPISFRAGMATRVNPELDYASKLSTFYVTAFANSHQATNNVLPSALFADEPFYLMGANLYASTSNYKWPENVKQIEFFAYAPSLEEIETAALTQLDPTAENYSALESNYKQGIGFYNLCQDNVALDPMNAMETTFEGVTLYKGFKLGRFYVATDISQQLDFITAHIAANAPATEDEAKLGVKLEFKHQLSNVELRAFSANPDYNIEVAGVRIGRPYTGNAIFNFCDKDGNVYNTDGGQWGISKTPQRLPVDYVYGAGDEIVRLGKFNTMNGSTVVTTNAHTTADDAVSLMGLGGNAMVLPTKNGAWAGKDNPWIASKYSAASDGKDPKPWSADNAEGDMYFSVLLRVTLKPKDLEVSNQQIYPYGNTTKMNVVYLEKDKNSNKIIGRVPSKASPVGANNEIVEFGWASVPVSVNWLRGNKYVYTLDFSEGVGIQDPEDARPGMPIIGSGIKFSVEVKEWTENSSSTTIPKE